MKAMLKLFMLKEIADLPSTGYSIIKKCEEKLGYKPSAGSIYPMLKSLEKEGLIVAKKEGRRIIYSASKKGLQFIDGIKKIREEFYKKLQSHIMATAEIFNDAELKNMADMFKKYPALKKILFLLNRMDDERANKLLDEIYRRLKNESNRNKRSGKRI